MVIVHGLYRFKPKLVGFRNDYCLTCNTVKRAVAVRTFMVIHLFWIPLIPLGFWKEWECSECENHPHAYPGTRRSFKWAGVVALVIMSGVLWMMPPDPEFSAPWLWAFRIGTSVGALLVLRNLLTTPPDVRLKSELVFPATEMECPFCGMPLVVAERYYCPGCGAVRY